MANRSFTLREVAEALINDPTPKAKGSFFKRKVRARRYEDVNASAVTIGDAMYSDRYSTAEIGATCALGGVALGLGVTTSDLTAALAGITCDLGLAQDSKSLTTAAPWSLKPDERKRATLNNLIIAVNDGTNMSKREIGERILKYCADFLDVKMDAKRVKYRVSKAIQKGESNA